MQPFPVLMVCSRARLRKAAIASVAHCGVSTKSVATQLNGNSPSQDVHTTPSIPQPALHLLLVFVLSALFHLLRSTDIAADDATVVHGTKVHMHIRYNAGEQPPASACCPTIPPTPAPTATASQHLPAPLEHPARLPSAVVVACTCTHASSLDCVRFGEDLQILAQ